MFRQWLAMRFSLLNTDTQTPRDRDLLRLQCFFDDRIGATITSDPAERKWWRLQSRDLLFQHIWAYPFQISAGRRRTIRRNISRIPQNRRIYRPILKDDVPEQAKYPQLVF